MLTSKKNNQRVSRIINFGISKKRKMLLRFVEIANVSIIFLHPLGSSLLRENRYTCVLRKKY